MISSLWTKTILSFWTLAKCQTLKQFINQSLGKTEHLYIKLFKLNSNRDLAGSSWKTIVAVILTLYALCPYLKFSGPISACTYSSPSLLSSPRIYFFLPLSSLQNAKENFLKTIRNLLALPVLHARGRCFQGQDILY